MIAYNTLSVTSLLSTDMPGLANAEIKVMSHGQELKDPYVVKLRVQNRSGRDIADTDFTKDRPMVFDLGAEIVATLGLDGSKELLPVVRVRGS